MSSYNFCVYYTKITRIYILIKNSQNFSSCIQNVIIRILFEIIPIKILG